jgi:hypothetical protein
MMGHSQCAKFTFRLPRQLRLVAPTGRHQPCVDGCVLVIHRGVVTIEGQDPHQVISHAQRFLKVAARGLGRARDGEREDT